MNFNSSYSDKSSSLLRRQFWTVFGQYMAPIPSADGEKINWINYKTEVRFIRFKLQLINNKEAIVIELSHPDLNVQLQQFEQLELFKKQFQQIVGTDWRWQKMNKNAVDKINCTIETLIENVNINMEFQWTEIISFFKPRLIALDNFWCSHKFAFQV